MTKIKQKTFFRNKIVTKKYLTEILFWSFRNYGMARACFLADNIKKLGFQYATQAGISINIEDLKVPTLKTEFIDKANLEMQKADIDLSGGKITEVERYQQLTDNWNMTSEKLKDQVVNYLKNCDPLNPIYLMSSSGARGNLSQVRQLVGMRGLMAGPTGDIIDIPITKNFREGLTITDYMISAYGARKGLVDTALKTAESGYLTRRLIDVAQDVLIRETDCYTKRGIFLYKLNNNKGTIISLKDRLLGRILAKDIFYKHSKKIIAFRNQQITPLLAKKIEQEEFLKVVVRSPLTCELNRSVCQNCYGWNLSHGKLVDLGEAVGIIAAQSIGEPGTQLTMRTFHTGGVFTAESNSHIFSKVSGQIFFPGKLKTYPLRTSDGKDALILEIATNIEVLNFKNQVSKIFLNKDTILFVKNKEFIRKNQIIASLPQTRPISEKREKKDIYSNIDGEIYFPKSNKKLNSFSKISPTGIIWVLSGKVYNLPHYAKIKKYKYSKLDALSSIANIKIVSYRSGILKVNTNENKVQKNNYQIKLLKKSFLLKNSQLLKGIFKQNPPNYQCSNQCIIKFENNQYFNILGNLKINNDKTLEVGKLLNTNYKTNIDGIVNAIKVKSNSLKRKSKSYHLNQGGTIFFLPEETYYINKDICFVYVVNGEWVEKNTELATNIYSKNSGFIEIISKNNIVGIIKVKLGSFINLKNEKIDSNLDKKIFFPGETIFSFHQINQLTYTQIIKNSINSFLLLRPIFLYELPKRKTEKKIGSKKKFQKNFDIVSYTNFKNNEKILLQKDQLFSLVETKLIFFNNDTNLNKSVVEILFAKQPNNNLSLECNIFENIFYNNQIPKEIDNTQLQLSLFLKDGEYIEPYTTLANIEILPKLCCKIKTLKERKQYDSRRILLISSEHYKTLYTEDKNKILKNQSFIRVGDLLSTNLISLHSGKIEKNFGNSLSIRLAQPFLLSEGAEIFWTQNNFIKRYEALGVLFYQRAQTGDIVQGLPKIEEILEARKSKILIKSPKNPGLVLNKLKNNTALNFIYINKYGLKFCSLLNESILNEQEIFLHSESFLDVGQPINSRVGNPHYTLNYLNHCYKNFLEPYDAAYRSLRKIQSYLLNSIQSVYYSQGVAISDKHLEIIIKQMTSKIRVENRGDSGIISGEYIDLYHANHINRVLKKTNAQEIFYIPILLGITKASLITDSFISSASFQETVRVLTEAAIKGKVDWLRGLKENVIIGRLIPAGTGFNIYEHISHLNLRVPTIKSEELTRIDLTNNNDKLDIR